MRFAFRVCSLWTNKAQNRLKLLAFCENCFDYIERIYDLGHLRIKDKRYLKGIHGCFMLIVAYNEVQLMRFIR